MQRTLIDIDAPIRTTRSVSIPLPLLDPNFPDPVTRRALGAFYTPSSAADYMADWIVRHDGERVLEPSFGDGIFLRAVATSAARRNFAGVRLSGVEIDEAARARAFQTQTIPDTDLRCQDFLSVAPFRVQAVIGNPPYVRLRHVADDQRDRALDAARVATGRAMDPAGSLWMPFLLHAMRFLDIGGRLAFVLPYDFTYVRYARPLWQELGRRFGSLEVLRTHERVFPDLLQDVVILLADGYGSSTETVRYRAFEAVDDLLKARPVVNAELSTEDLLRGERVFVEALLGTELRSLLRGGVAERTVSARRLMTFNIGYVAGDKSFFHPSDLAVEEYGIPPRSLRPSLTSARSIKGVGLRTSSLGPSRGSQLFFPDPGALTEGERRYVAMGERHGVATRYKCRIREPWYVVPGTRVPDVVLSVFSERPILLVNDAGCFASNSLLCGYSLGPTSAEIAARWYTSLTLLQCELEVHALGGGVMVMVPREAGNVRLPERARADADHAGALDRLLRRGKTEDAYRAGDHPVLVRQCGLTPAHVELIRHGIDVLAHWRTSARTGRRQAASEAPVPPAVAASASASRTRPRTTIGI